MREEVIFSGGTGPKSQTAESLHHQKLPLFQFRSFRFSFLLLIGAAFLLMYYGVSSNSLSWWESFPLHVQYQKLFNNTNKKHIPPSYKVHPKHMVLQKEPDAPPVIQYHPAYARNYQFVMDDTDACKTKAPFLVLMVPVAPSEVAARDAIRKTWGNETVVRGEQVKTLFMLGLPGGAMAELYQEKLRQESSLYHDVIQSNFLDTYLNLTTKTMVIMDWLATRCPTAVYAMKIDSDMFLNIDNLMIMLQKPDIPKLNYLTGMLMWQRPVIRSKNSKWYVPEEMFPDSTYPTYTLGMGYLFSNDLPAKLVEISKSITAFNIEDAYVGMCMKKLGLAPTAPPDPWQFKAYLSVYNRCEFSKVITYILSSAKDLLKYWTDLYKPGPPC
ncbi:beta-1,3-galactosyltransferase 1-like [Genypterus blacodes]|uniref:beta-1,3-galactosyltransferase 1-like n=1 Tax=Genypterus blacodes TaxID=154954 RepID=UPI003F76AD3C